MAGIRHRGGVMLDPFADVPGAAAFEAVAFIVLLCAAGSTIFKKFFGKKEEKELEISISENDSGSGKKYSASQFIVTILIGLLLFLIKGIVNYRLGFKHGGGALLAGFSAAAIFGLCAVIFNSNVFKFSKNKDKSKKTRFDIAIVSVLTLITILWYSVLLNEIPSRKAGLENQQKAIEKALGIVENKSPEIIKNDRYVEYFEKYIDINNPSSKIIEANADKANGDILNKLWKSNSLTYRITSQSFSGGYVATFHINFNFNTCNIFPYIYIYSKTKEKIISMDNLLCEITFDNDLNSKTFAKYNVKNRGKSSPINEISLDIADEKYFIYKMKQGNTITLFFRDINLSTTFGLQGFTASFNRINQLCRSNSR
jgi:hypothetical protein